MRLLFITCTMLFCLHISGQDNRPVDTLSPPEGFSAYDDITATYDSFSHTYRMNFQDGKKLYRRIYDTAFRLVDEYALRSAALHLSPKPLSSKANFVTPLVTDRGYFEVYAIYNGVEIYHQDFRGKKDSLVAQLKFDPYPQAGEQILSLVPGRDGLKIVTYSKKKNALLVHKWRPEDSTLHFEFPLPKTNLSKEEERAYDKDCQIKLNKLWNSAFVSSQINAEQQLPAGNHLFYNGDRMFMLIRMPYALGFFMMDVDIASNKLKLHNFFVNSLQANAEWNAYYSMMPVAMVYDSTLVIQNSSHSKFEYLFFNIETHKLIRRYSVNVSDSLYHLVHSSLTQKGTYGSREEEKEISKTKAFMRKIDGSFSFITMPRLEADSVVFTLSNLKQTMGIEGTFLFATSTFVGGMANIHAGNLYFTPYLTSHRMKLFFAHSKFHRHTLEPSKQRNVEMAIDQIIDTFAVKELAMSSTFQVQRNGQFVIGVLNPERKIFELTRFVNK